MPHRAAPGAAVRVKLQQHLVCTRGHVKKGVAVAGGRGLGPFGHVILY